MKNTLIIGILCLGIGFGAGWLVKPAAVEKQADSGPPPRKAPALTSPRGSSSAKPADQPSKSVDKSGNPSIGRFEVSTEEADALTPAVEVQRVQNRWADALTQRQKTKEEARIKKLVDRLGLTKAQADQLRTYFEKNRVDLTAMMENNEGDWSQAKDWAKKLRGDGFEDELAKLLTDEQKEAYAEMKARDRENKMEARAYKDLAKVQSALDLSQEQKDQVYDILYQQAGNKIDANQDANALMSIWTEGFGVEFDAEEFGISNAIQVQIDKAESGDAVDQDPNAWMKAVQEGNQKRIDEQVALLAPVLDDDQEAAYRAHLESKGASLFGGFLGEVGTDVDPDVKTLNVETSPQLDE